MRPGYFRTTDTSNLFADHSLGGSDAKKMIVPPKVSSGKLIFSNLNAF